MECWQAAPFWRLSAQYTCRLKHCFLGWIHKFKINSYGGKAAKTDKYTWGQPSRPTSKWPSTRTFILSSHCESMKDGLGYSAQQIHHCPEHCPAGQTEPCLSLALTLCPRNDALPLYSHSDHTVTQPEGTRKCQHPDIFVEQHRWLAASKKVILSFHRGPEDVCSRQGIVVNTRNIPMITVLGR